MNKPISLCKVVVSVASLLIWASAAFAWQMEPTPTKSVNVVISQETLIKRLEDRATPKITALMSASVHERIAHHIYGCEGDEDICSKPGDVRFSPAAIIAGVEWNDNPPFLLKKASLDSCTDAIKNQQVIQLPKQSLCWAALLKDAEKKAKENVLFDYASGAALALRVHYGDLQFLHSMASHDGEDPTFTRQRILMWAEFIWRVATGDFVLGTRLAQTNIDGMKELFSSGWSVQQIFTLGDPTFRRQIKDVAFGSLIHMVSDSFALSHTDRTESTGDLCKGTVDFLEPGRIVNFHAYGNQDHKKHAAKDTQDALELHFATVGPNIVEIGKNLLALYQKGSKWDEVKPYLECIFTLDEAAAPAGPGELFKLEQ